MNPLEQKVAKLEQEIIEMRQGRDLEMIENVRRFAVGTTLSVANSSASAAPINTVADGVNVAQDYDFMIILQDADGNQYKLGRYN